MMNLKSLMKTCAASAVLCASGKVLAVGEGWTPDLLAAKMEAASTNKDLFIEFTGSDWCPWCIKMNDEILKHEAFKAGVKDHFVLVGLDFPKDKTKVHEEILKRNEDIGERYQVGGYPTILLCEPGGKPYAATGYMEGGPEVFLKKLEELRKLETSRDEAFATAEKTEGVAKAKLLVDTINAMDLGDKTTAAFYGDILKKIKEADPQDETGYFKEVALRARMADIRKEASGLVSKEDFTGAIAVLDKARNGGGLPIENVQDLMASRARVFARWKKFDEAFQSIDEGKALAPVSDRIATLDELKKKIIEDRDKPPAPKEPAAGEKPAEETKPAEAATPVEEKK